MSSYVGLSNAFSVDNGIIYEPKAANKKIGFYAEEVTKSINAYINLLSEFANMMIDNFIDDKKQKETVKKLVSHYGREIDRKWKKY
jgi:hypothetical protein